MQGISAMKYDLLDWVLDITLVVGVVAVLAINYKIRRMAKRNASTESPEQHLAETQKWTRIRSIVLYTALTVAFLYMLISIFGFGFAR